VYRNSAGAFPDVPGGSQNLLGGSWHRFRLEFDEHSGEYIKFICDSLEADMSGLAYSKAANTNPVCMLVTIQEESAALSPPEMWFDDVLVMEI
jgi:hypothetical protein